MLLMSRRNGVPVEEVWVPFGHRHASADAGRGDLTLLPLGRGLLAVRKGHQRHVQNVGEGFVGSLHIITER